MTNDEIWEREQREKRDAELSRLRAELREARETEAAARRLLAEANESYRVMCDAHESARTELAEKERVIERVREVVGWLRAEAAEQYEAADELEAHVEHSRGAAEAAQTFECAADKLDSALASTPAPEPSQPDKRPGWVAAAVLKAKAKEWRKACSPADYDAGREDCADELDQLAQCSQEEE